MPPESVTALLRQAESALARSPHPDRARADAELLLRHAVGQSRAWLLAHADDPLDADTAARFHSLLHRRILGEPVQYILGEAEFHSLTLAVNPSVLIPRPETELLVERVLAFLAQTKIPAPRLLDIGTGSGAIAIACAVANPTAQITAVDLSPASLAVARQNAARHHVAARITFRESDLFAALTGERFHCIASNPPYVPLADAATLAAEVRDHEPALALFAGPDGLDLYRRLIPAARQHLHPGGLLALEIGFGQRDAIAALLADSRFHQIEFLSDYQQIPRIATAIQPQP